ncbi:MAG: hypothetical protein GY749_46690 [Desulfobacteraceae bacterium]|nr:hypothetical protein [Desulfobacteraceae bacterium]
MKKMSIFVSVVLILLGVSHFGYADVYPAADIILDGDEHSNITRKWSEDGYGAIRTAWDNLWVEYEAELTEGSWNIGLNVINDGNIGSNGWYTHFEIHNSLTDEIIAIPASDSEINYGFVNVIISSAGIYTVRYTWKNDKYSPPLDANIKIDSVFFDNTATPPFF